MNLLVQVFYVEAFVASYGEALAQMVGTTRSRVNYFMNKFRRLGYIDYNGTIVVNRPLLENLGARGIAGFARGGKADGGLKGATQARMSFDRHRKLIRTASSPVRGCASSDAQARAVVPVTLTSGVVAATPVRP